MKKILLTGLTALVLATTNAGTVFAEEKNDINCISKARTESVASQIPQYFKEIRPDVYLIDIVPGSKNGHGKGGQLTVYIPSPNRLSIFDRTDSNPKRWYNVSNSGSDEIGCTDMGIIYFNKSNPNETTAKDSQEKFNAFIQKVERKIK